MTAGAGLSRRLAVLGFCAAALVALVFVGRFTAADSDGWTDLRQTPHLAATVGRAAPADGRATPARQSIAFVPTAVLVLAVFVALATVGVASDRKVAADASPPPLGRAPPESPSVVAFT